MRSNRKTDDLSKSQHELAKAHDEFLKREIQRKSYLASAETYRQLGKTKHAECLERLAEAMR
mgnify:FL=1